MAATDAADDQLDLKKRARRRLVGAAALALLAVIVFPMVMDREPKPATQDIQVVIPSQDAPKLALKSAPAKRAVSDDDAAASAPEAAAPAPKSVDAAKADLAAASKPEAPKQETKPEAKSESKPDDKAGSKTAEKTADKPAKDKADKPADKPADKTAAKKADEARAAAALEGKSNGSGQWVVQIGAYQNAGNVKLIVSKMKEMGIPSFTEKLDTPQGSRIRVRAGPFPSRDAAEKAQAKMKIIGVSGPVAPK